MGGQPTPDSARPPPNVSVYRANARLNGLPAISARRAESLGYSSVSTALRNA